MNRRGAAARAAVALSLLLVVCTACGSLPDSLHPASGRGASVRTLYDVSLVIGAMLIAAIIALVVWILVRYRAGRSDTASPVSGNRRLEVTWTLGTIAVVASLFLLSVHTMRTVDATAGPDALEIHVIGHQWWWEFRYPATGVVTAGDLHVPTNTPIHFVITSDDVIHSFWVPRFGWKQDAIPGHPNSMSLTLDQAGTFRGVCTEFCGAEHAWMRFRVVAESPQAFDTWLTAQQVVPPSPQPGGLAYHGADLFTSLPCASCHTIAGTSAHGTVGPNLTHVGSRVVLAGGVIDNTPANMKRWLTNPHAVKPDVLMPNLDLTPDQVDALTAYLEGLK